MNNAHIILSRTPFLYVEDKYNTEDKYNIEVLQR